jgi:hypothetical protein
LRGYEFFGFPADAPNALYKSIHHFDKHVRKFLADPEAVSAAASVDVGEEDILGMRADSLRSLYAKICAHLNVDSVYFQVPGMWWSRLFQLRKSV